MESIVVLFGWPVAHSRSPRMHQAAFDYHGMPYRYEARASRPDDFHRDWHSALDEGMVGANLTVPHKQRVLALLDEVDSEAEMVGAVNTVVIRDGRTHGYNTDTDGLLGPLREVDFDLPGRPVVVLGAGGAARAVVAATAAAGCGSISVVARRVEAAARVLGAVPAGFPGEATAQSWSQGAWPQDALLVNATTVGLSSDDDTPVPAAQLPTAGLVFDCVYGESPRRLIRDALARGIPAIDGQRMLLHQGMTAYHLWTGRPAPLQVMEAALASD